MRNISNSIMRLPNRLLLDEAIQVLKNGKDVEIPIEGSSMLPWLRPGRDTVVLTAAPPSELRRGHIVIAMINDKSSYVLHRIIKRQGEWLTLMGDANLHVTEKVKISDVAGLAIYIKRNGRYHVLNSRYERRKGILWILLKPLRPILLPLFRLWIK